MSFTSLWRETIGLTSLKQTVKKRVNTALTDDGWLETLLEMKASIGPSNGWNGLQ